MDLEKAIIDVTEFFGGKIYNIPQIILSKTVMDIGDRLQGLGFCRYPDYIVLLDDISPMVPYTVTEVLEHELIHWMERDMDLVADDDNFPHHMLHMLFHGNKEKNRVLESAGGIGDLQFQYFKNKYIYDDIKDLKDSFEIEHIKMIERYLASTAEMEDTVVRNDIRLNNVINRMYDIHNAFLSIHIADRIGDPKEAIYILREVKEKNMFGIGSYESLLSENNFSN